MAERRRLRGEDALHLASAVLLKNRLAEPVVFATWDANLAAAARREGLEGFVRRLDDGPRSP